MTLVARGLPGGVATCVTTGLTFAGLEGALAGGVGFFAAGVFTATLRAGLTGGSTTLGLLACFFRAAMTAGVRFAGVGFDFALVFPALDGLEALTDFLATGFAGLVADFHATLVGFEARFLAGDFMATESFGPRRVVWDHTGRGYDPARSPSIVLLTAPG